MYIRITFSIELRLRVSRSLRSLANDLARLYVMSIHPVVPGSFTCCIIDWSKVTNYFNVMLANLKSSHILEASKIHFFPL